MNGPESPESLQRVVAPSLDLERVVPAAGAPDAAGLTCSACNQPVADEYFEIAGKATCRSCRFAIEEAMTGGSGVARMMRASLAGTLAAAVGAYLYHALSTATEREFAIAALVLGAMVGWAVRWGSRRRGGWGYQWMAVLLTYASIGGAHLPEFVEGIQVAMSEPAVKPDAASPEPAAGPTPTPAPAIDASSSAKRGEPQPGAPPWMENHPLATLVVVGIVALAVAGAWPLFLLASDPGTALIGLLITYFALHAAWKMNRRLVLDFTGPYRVVKDPDAAPIPAR